MRTKTLAVMAAIGALGAAYAMADVYSANVVGFVNQPVVAGPSGGWNLLANPLNATNNDINTVLVMPADPDLDYAVGVQYYDPDAGWVGPSTWQGAGAGGWDFPMTLAPGRGFFISTSKDFNLTFVGEVLQGPLTVDLNQASYQTLGSKVPQKGNMVGDLVFPAQAGDTIYIYDATNGTYAGKIYSAIDDGGGSYFWDPAEPVLDVAAGFWLIRDPGMPTNPQWIRTFNVN